MAEIEGHSILSGCSNEWDTLKSPDTSNAEDIQAEPSASQRGAIISEILNESIKLERLINIVIGRLSKSGSFDFESLSGQDKEAINESPYSVEQLIQFAKERIFHEKCGEALASLSEYNTVEVPEKDRNLVDIVIDKLCESRSQSREQLRDDATNFAYEIYFPSVKEREISDIFANSIAESISDDDISEYVGADIDKILENPDNLDLALEKFGKLFNKCLNLHASVEFEDAADTKSVGYYDPYMDEVKINASRFEALRGYFRKNLKNNAEGADYSSLCILASFATVVSREFMRAYQYAYKERHDDDRALKYSMNLANCVEISNGTVNHEAQLIEREASAFSEAFRRKLIGFVANRWSDHLNNEVGHERHMDLVLDENKYDQNLALTAVGNRIFDGRPLSLYEALLIERNGGFKKVLAQVKEMNATNFNEYELINMLDENGGRFAALTPRELSAIRWMSNAEGYSNIYDFISFEHLKRDTPHREAVKIIYHAMSSSSVRAEDIDYMKVLSPDDYEVIKEYNLGELIWGARKWAYAHYSDSIIGRLSGHGEYSDHMSKEELEGLRYIIDKYGNGEEVEARNIIQGMISSIYTPNEEEISNDEFIAARYAESISDEMIKTAISDLYKSGSIFNFIENVAHIVKSTLPLSADLAYYRISINRTPPKEGEASALGSCVHKKRIVNINITHANELSVDSVNFFEVLAEVIAHEHFHAYQHVSKNHESSEIAIRRNINKNKYRPSENGHHEYRMQLIEREAYAYGKAVSKRFAEHLDGGELRRIFK